MTLTKTDRERVTPAAGHGDVPGTRPPVPSSSPPLPRGRGGSRTDRGAAKEPTAPKASRNTAMPRAPPGRPWPAGGAPRYDELTHTTLGNGYLGSRIDEERSEMRYLV